mgnify:CR=1 FL=1
MLAKILEKIFERMLEKCQNVRMKKGNFLVMSTIYSCDTLAYTNNIFLIKRFVYGVESNNEHRNIDIKYGFIRPKGIYIERK